MGYSLNQPQFKWSGGPRNTAVHLEGSQNVFIPQRNIGRPKNMQAELQSALHDRTKIPVIRGQDHRDNVAYLKIDSRTQFVQNPGERCTHRNEFENALFSTQQAFLFAKSMPMRRRSVRRTFAARFVFSHPSHLVIEVAQILGRTSHRSLSTLVHFSFCLWIPRTQGRSKHYTLKLGGFATKKRLLRLRQEFIVSVNPWAKSVRNGTDVHNTSV
jgi:hypothetical protein